MGEMAFVESKIMKKKPKPVPSEISFNLKGVNAFITQFYTFSQLEQKTLQQYFAELDLPEIYYEP